MSAHEVQAQFPFLRLFPRVLLFEELPPAALGFEAGAVLLLTEGLEAGAVERVVVVERVAVLRDGCFTCGAVLLCTFGLEAGVDFLLTDGLRAGVVERVIVVDRVVVLRDGCFTCGAVLLVAFLLTDGLRSGVLERVVVPGCLTTSFLLR